MANCSYFCMSCRWEEFNSFSRALANGIPAFKMVKYLETEAERAPYRVTFKDGKCFNSKGNLLDTGDMMSGKVHFKPTRERNETGKGSVREHRKFSAASAQL